MDELCRTLRRLAQEDPKKSIRLGFLPVGEWSCRDKTISFEFQAPFLQDIIASSHSRSNVSAKLRSKNEKPATVATTRTYSRRTNQVDARRPGTSHTKQSSHHPHSSDTRSVSGWSSSVSSQKSFISSKTSQTRQSALSTSVDAPEKTIRKDSRDVTKGCATRRYHLLYMHVFAYIRRNVVWLMDISKARVQFKFRPDEDRGRNAWAGRQSKVKSTQVRRIIS
jgi:hypothetical protein